MKTLKKSLAIVIALALCLSAFMGCFSVSAVDANGVSIATVIDGDTAIVDFTLEAVADDAFTVALFDIEFADELNIVGVDVDGIDPATGLPYPDEPAIEISTDSGVELAEISHNSITNGVADVSVANAAKAIRVIVETKAVANIADATVTITFDIAGLGAKDYAVSVTNVQAATAGTYDGVNWGNDEELIKFGDATTTTAAGAITVAPAHVHAPAEGVYEKNADQHWQVCAEHPDVIVGDKAVHSYENGVCVCGAEEPADECEHVWEVTAATPATSDASYQEVAKGSITLKCSVCGTETTPAEVSYHMYSSLLTPYLNCGSQTQLLFRTWKSMIDTVGAVDSAKLIVTQTYASGATNNIIFDFADRKTYKDKNNTVYEWAVGVPGKMLSDRFTATLYTCVDGKWYSGILTETSVKQSAMSVVKDSTDEKLKKVAADLLVMGAKAQVYFDNYNAENLADSELVGEYAKYITTTKPSLVKDDTNYIYKSDMTLVNFLTPQILMEDAIKFEFKILTDYYVGEQTLDNLSLHISYIGASGSTIEDTVPITKNVTGSKTQYVVEAGVLARYLRTPITVSVYNDTTLVSPEVVFSIESLLKIANDANSKLNGLADAIMNYADSADAYFSA